MKSKVNESTEDNIFSFKGKNMDKTSINLNRYGDVYLHDVLCTDVYTYYVCPCNILAQK